MKHLETLLKVIIIGILTALFRAYGQGFIPIVEEPLLWPSIFADGGITTLAFVVFGSLFYTAIAALFLLMNRNMRGNKLIKGLRFSFFLILIWTAYILEPLPHVTVTDKITYPLVDGGALLLLGILSGLLLGDNKKKSKESEGMPIQGDGEAEATGQEEKNFLKRWKNVNVKKIISISSFLNLIIIGLFFFLGRIAMYKFWGIYSYFGTHSIETLIWVLCTGFIIGIVFELMTPYICSKMWYLKFFIFGALYLAVILIGFNGFKPLIYRMDIMDLLVRTIGDCVSVILAGGICLSFDFKKNLKEAMDKQICNKG